MYLKKWAVMIIVCTHRPCTNLKTFGRRHPLAGLRESIVPCGYSTATTEARVTHLCPEASCWHN